MRVDEINNDIRLFRLGIHKSSSIKFLPGQWLDTFVPTVSKPGGFTLTSPPSAATSLGPYLELAVQKSPTNPPAAWLWSQPLTTTAARPELRVRVGGSFVWPPRGTDLAALRRVVLVAGGVGVNPLVSILAHLAEGDCPYDVQFLYSTKAAAGLDAEGILFAERLASIYGREKVRGRLRLFLTGLDAASGWQGATLPCNEMEVSFEPRRITLDDIAEAMGPRDEHASAVVYVCGVPSMTDEFVQKLTSAGGLALRPEQVLCEKWW
ncbi:Oxidoreductase NAD-binding domain-containing protein 1 [Colletotrichum chlorophyti]|uniref:Oxidoreductase NAD-binding domain-containing protein 1 n=1 Tax=Colletotrichum chlorophyti TaxID=708187 RepID=A0A1Q8S7D1_9PEZI|nr:Oxidoreductase NAD-binding domain-containing protein 1 [Colletotrichum chlorophyti]